MGWISSPYADTLFSLYQNRLLHHLKKIFQMRILQLKRQESVILLNDIEKTPRELE